MTEKYLRNATSNSHKIKYNDKKFIDNKTNIEYSVDGKHVKFEPSLEEKEVAEWIAKTLGGKIELNLKILEPEKTKVPDYYYNDLRFDLKKIKENEKTQ